jgi:RimJ/RimL family protein N-acetyltransferase
MTPDIMVGDLEFIVRPAEVSDAGLISSYRNDGDWHSLHDANMYDAAQTATWLKNMPSSSKRLMITRPPFVDYWGIRPMLHYGIIRIDHIDQNNRTCFVGMDIYPDYRGKGLSKPFYQWLFVYLFENLNMNALYLEVIEDNHIAIKTYRSIGFQETGRWPQRVFRDGVYKDALLFSLLRKDYLLKKEA